MKFYIGITFLCLGGFICLFNFYLSYIRYGIYRLMGGVREEYRFASGIPMIGSLLVMVAVICLYGTSLFYLGIVALLFDTAGPLWLLFTVIYNYFAD